VSSYILIQSAGTGFVAGAFFSFALAVFAAGEPALAGDDAGVVLAAGFWLQPLASTAIAVNVNKILFMILQETVFSDGLEIVILEMKLNLYKDLSECR